MGKASMCIQMLQLLNTGRVFKISELADILDTNPRNVIEYKKELEECGYYIDTIPGRYGGYKLNQNNLIPSIALLPEEKDIFNDAINYINLKTDFVNKKVINKVFGKIASAVKLPNNDNVTPIINHYQISLDEEEIQKRYNFIKQSIELKNVVEIEYNSIKNGRKTHILHPYKLFVYNNAWFFLAWNPEAGDVWTFKLNRIETWKQLKEKFKVWKYFKPENYIKDSSLTSNGEHYHIVYLATGVRKHLASERIYGKNQKVEEIDENTIKVSVDMQSKELIVSYILSCGSDITVLEPEWLIDIVKETINNIKEKYYTRGG